MNIEKKYKKEVIIGKFVLFFIIILTSCSLNRKKNNSMAFQKVNNGIFPVGTTTVIVRDIDNDTLCASYRELRRTGWFSQNYTGKYFITRNLNRIHFKCNIKEGVLCGDYTGYYGGDTNKILCIGYLTNGYRDGYQISYFSNGSINHIGCRCNRKNVGNWVYFSRDEELIKIEYYENASDSCHIPNQYLFENLPKKYQEIMSKNRINE